MKYLILTLLSIFFINPVQAQEDNAARDFIKSIMPAEKKIIYVDSISLFTINQMSEALNRNPVGNIIYVDKKGRRSAFAFTKEEKKYINYQLTKMRKYAWGKGLFDTCTLVSQDTVNKVFKNGYGAWEYFHSKYGSGFYDFSKPIFIRNHTVCIFSKNYSCDWLCGDGDLAIYVRKGKKWVVKYLLASWES